MMILDVLPMLDQIEGQTRAALVQQTTAKGMAGLINWLSGKRRAQRRQVHEDFHRVALRCRYRTQVLTQVLSSQRDITGIIGLTDRYTLTLEMLERLTEDLAELTYFWRRISSGRQQDLIDAAEEVVVALAAQLGERDPGWMRPQLRTAHRERMVELGIRVATAFTAYEALAANRSGWRRGSRAGR